MDYPCESIEIKILLSIQAASNYNPRKANKNAALSAALSHYSHWGDVRYQNSNHIERPPEAWPEALLLINQWGARLGEYKMAITVLNQLSGLWLRADGWLFISRWPVASLSWLPRTQGWPGGNSNGRQRLDKQESDSRTSGSFVASSSVCYWH